MLNTDTTGQETGEAPHRLDGHRVNHPSAMEVCARCWGAGRGCAGVMLLGFAGEPRRGGNRLGQWAVYAVGLPCTTAVAAMGGPGVASDAWPVGSMIERCLPVNRMAWWMRRCRGATVPSRRSLRHLFVRDATGDYQRSRRTDRGWLGQEVTNRCGRPATPAWLAPCRTARRVQASQRPRCWPDAGLRRSRCRRMVRTGPRPAS